MRGFAERYYFMQRQARFSVKVWYDGIHIRQICTLKNEFSKQISFTPKYESLHWLLRHCTQSLLSSKMKDTECCINVWRHAGRKVLCSNKAQSLTIIHSSYFTWLWPEFSILLDKQKLEVSNVLLSKILWSVNTVPSEELKVLLLVEKSAHYIASLQSLPVIKNKVKLKD